MGASATAVAQLARALEDLTGIPHAVGEIRVNPSGVVAAVVLQDAGLLGDDKGEDGLTASHAVTVEVQVDFPASGSLAAAQAKALDYIDLTAEFWNRPEPPADNLTGWFPGALEFTEETDDNDRVMAYNLAMPVTLHVRSN